MSLKCAGLVFKISHRIWWQLSNSSADRLTEVRSSVPEVDDDSHVGDVGLVDDADELNDNFDP